MTQLTPEQIAEWMVEELEREQYLYQQVVVSEIATRFGEEFTYSNQRGNLAIDARVLAAFRRITGDTVVWERRQRMWRKRNDADEPGRRQY
jgi:hypothetical protein